MEKKSIYTFVDEYLILESTKNKEKLEQLEEEGNRLTATYTDVAKAITNLTYGINEQLTDVHSMVASLLSILVEAMYEEKVIDQKVLDKIEEYQNKLYEKEDE
ncbi:hypothetical protein TwortDSMZ_136 [Staphylococcus phage Twort]|uniref:Uncharacterized protein n=2 Tax=Staphylococcus phage Twort (strain DSM 17442 / HER 48) TaxID=2908167 RepID=A0A6H0X5E0_BPTWO|nr:hypothetical protein TwortDSMZ_136 [Staphylococcus phage Twort]